MTSRPHRTSSRSHERLVDAYLADLERALHHLDADERDEVVASVREHIDTALSEHDGAPTPRDVEAVLQQLGPVEQIASDTGDGVHRSSGGGEPATRAREGWLLVALAAASLVLVFIPFVAVPLALGVIAAAAISMRGESGPVRRRYRIAATLGGIALLATLLFAVFFLAAETTGPTPAEPESAEPIED